MEQNDDIYAGLTGNTPPSGQQPSEGSEQRRWFRRFRKGITTSTADKKETPEGLWNKCPECNYITTTTELEENLFVCPKCNYHHRISSEDYFAILFDNRDYNVMYDNIVSKDFLGFTDL